MAKSNLRHFAAQKAADCKPKGRLSQGKRRPFANMLIISRLCGGNHLRGCSPGNRGQQLVIKILVISLLVTNLLLYLHTVNV